MVRHKNRYLVVDITTPTPAPNISVQSLQSTLSALVHRFHGDFGLAAVRQGFTVKYCNPHTHIAVIRARRGPHRLLASCLPFLTAVEGQSVAVHMVYTGATINQCFGRIREHQRRRIEEMTVNMSEKDREWLLKVGIGVEGIGGL